MIAESGLPCCLMHNRKGTLVTTVMGVMKGCMFVRVHDVQANVRAVRMTEAVLRGGRSNVQ